MPIKMAIFASFAFLASNAIGQYYETLPKGVRAGVFRNIQTSNIKSSFNHAKSETPYSYEIEASAKNLEGIENPKIQAALDLIRPYDDAYNALTAGNYKISADAKLNINAYGFAYGATDKVTAYAALPIFKANVQMRYQRTKQNTYSETAELMQIQTGNDGAQLYGNVIEALPDLDGQTMQSLIVNNFGYKEMGDWRGEGPGDLEFGAMYNFFKRPTYGLMVTLGGTAPTGREDDPDILQDIPFGDGQWDAFMEFGGGYRLNDKVILNSFARYTHQFSAEKELRIPYDQDISISEEKGVFREKLGNKLLFDLDAEYFFSDWINFQAAYLYESVGQAKYESEHGKANEYLAHGTGSSSHNIRLKAELSSVAPFMKKEFLLPAQIKFYYQTMIDGMNTPKVDRYEIEFRMFF